MGFLLPSFSLETWILIASFLALFMLYGIWPYNFFKKLGIPGPRPLPFIGTFLEYRQGLFHFDQKCHQKYGNIWGIFDGRQAVMAILDPTIIKTILVKEFHTLFTNRRKFRLNGELDSSLTTVTDGQWKRIRTVLSPTFTSGKLKEMLPIINHYGKVLVKNVQKRVDQGETMNMKDIFGAYSLDVVTSTSFSIDVDSLNNPNDPFIVNIKKLINFNFLNPLILLMVLFPFLKPLLNKLGVNIVPTRFVTFFFDVVKKFKKDRQENARMDRVDFLQLLVDSQSSVHPSEEAQLYKALTDKEILTQAIVFIIAGYETTSTTLTFLAYCLATHPDVQKRLQEEVDEAFPDQGSRRGRIHRTQLGWVLFEKNVPATPTYEAIFQMDYLDMVVNETLRLYPPGGRIERVCKSTVEISGVTIPEGTVTIIPAFVLHRDPRYWPEPEEYRPERFSKENKEAMDPYTFLPFGAGPRNCIGMRFALLVLKLAVVVLLQRFSFRPCAETLIPMELDTKGCLKPKRPIELKMVPRARAESEPAE